LADKIKEFLWEKAKKAYLPKKKLGLDGENEGRHSIILHKEGSGDHV